jgi:hypothetical protein
MSSVTSTEVTSTSGPAFRPWHFFVVLTLLGATAAVLSSQNVTPEHLIMLSVTVFAAGAVALAAYRMLIPFAGRDRRLSGESLGRRARAALEREKQLVLRSIKELEFDRAMGKLAADDFEVTAQRLRARALGLMRQIEAAGTASRDQVEGELAERLRREGVEQTRAPVIMPSEIVCDACHASNDADARFCKSCGTRLTSTRGAGSALVIAILCCLGGATFAQAQMPDLSQMTGRPLPSGDLPAGTVSVRVVRGALSNNVAGVEVRLQDGEQTLAATTDANGRATFVNVAVGRPWRAVSTVDRERLESQTFTMPSAGGIRMLLVAGLGAAAGTGSSAPTAPPGSPAGPGSPVPNASGPPVPGDVTLGTQSRFVIELAEDSVEVYGLFDLVNVGPAPVQPAAPIVFQLPREGRNVTVLEGSSPQAKADGNRVVVSGPFASGATPVQLAYRYPHEGGRLRISQALPLRLGRTTVIVRKLPGLELQVTNAQGQRDVTVEGRTYLVANGGPIDARASLDLTIGGLPHHRTWPRTLAVALALAILIGGLLLAWRATPEAPDQEELKALRARRATLFEQLVSLERRRIGELADEPGLLARRSELMTTIQALDETLAATLPVIPTSISPASAAALAAPAPPSSTPEGVATHAAPAEPAEPMGVRPAVR